MSASSRWKQAKARQYKMEAIRGSRENTHTQNSNSACVFSCFLLYFSIKRHKILQTHSSIWLTVVYISLMHYIYTCWLTSIWLMERCAVCYVTIKKAVLQSKCKRLIILHFEMSPCHLWGKFPALFVKRNLRWRLFRSPHWWFVNNTRIMSSSFTLKRSALSMSLQVDNAVFLRKILTRPRKFLMSPSLLRTAAANAAPMVRVWEGPVVRFALLIHKQSKSEA